jgi:hypothetical protein
LSNQSKPQPVQSPLRPLKKLAGLGKPENLLKFRDGNALRPYFAAALFGDSSHLGQGGTKPIIGVDNFLRVKPTNITGL